jgi:hypothetical protein
MGVALAKPKRLGSLKKTLEDWKKHGLTLKIVSI